MKISTPTAEVGKTVVMETIGMVSAKVGVTPIGSPAVHDARDLPLYKELYNGEAMVQMLW